MFVSIVIATFLVVGRTSSDPVPSSEIELQWDRECTEQARIAVGALAGNHTMKDVDACFAECLLEKYGMMKDGRLVQRDKIGDWTAERIRQGPGSGRTPKEGKTVQELGETCFDTAKNKTGNCEAGGTFEKCIDQRLEELRPTSAY